MKTYLLVSGALEPMCKGETGKGVNFTNILLDDLSVAQYQLLLSQALYEQEI